MEWISVKDRLPEQGQEVLTYYNLIAQGMYYVDQYPNEMTENGDIVKELTHWMPLPEPPKDIEG